MLRLLLKLYPARFVEAFGEEWLRDTRQELREARTQGWVRVVGWAGRTLASVGQGAMTAHKQSWIMAISQGVEIQCGHETILLRADNNAHQTLIRYSLLNFVGCFIAGWMAFKLWLYLWVGGGLDGFGASAEAAIMALLMLVFLAGGLLIGAWMAWRHYVHKKTKTSKLASLAWMGFVAWSACSIGFMNWTLVDLGRASKDAIVAFEEYPETMIGMGLRDSGGAEVDWKVTNAKDEKCVRAMAVLDMSRQRAIRYAKDSTEVTGLLLVNSMAHNLAGRGCMDETSLVAFNQSLMDATVLTPQQERHMKWRGLGQLHAGRKEVIEKMRLTPSKRCEFREIKKASFAEEKVDYKAVQRLCAGAAVPKK